MQELTALPNSQPRFVNRVHSTALVAATSRLDLACFALESTGSGSAAAGEFASPHHSAVLSVTADVDAEPGCQR
jgi:hypothetical protein